MAGLRFPPHSRSAPICYQIRTTAGGRSSRLNFLRRTLSFPISNRFYPGTPGQRQFGVSTSTKRKRVNELRQIHSLALRANTAQRLGSDRALSN